MPSASSLKRDPNNENGTPKRLSFANKRFGVRLRSQWRVADYYDCYVRCKDIDVYYHVLLTASNPVGCRALLFTFEQSLNEFLLDFSKIIRGS